jgi:hypothetical protein
MSKNQDEFVRYQIRVPQEVYQQIEAIAISKGAKLHPRTKRPQLSETIVELLQLALEHSNSTDDHQSPSEKSPDLELIENSLVATQTQQLNTILEAQKQTQAELNRLYTLYHQLCDRLPIQEPLQKTWYSNDHESPQQIRPLESYSEGPWMVNRQWLNLNGRFNEEAFNEWNNGEIRQDQQGNCWRRVDLANTGEDFQIPADLAESQIFYVLAESKNSI